MASDTKIQFKSVSLEAFPVGSVFLSIVNTNPSTLLGYGTWSLIGDGRMIMGATAADDVTKTLTGGSMSKNVPLLAHTHTGPSHTHTGPSHTHSVPNHIHTFWHHHIGWDSINNGSNFWSVTVDVGSSVYSTMMTNVKNQELYHNTGTQSSGACTTGASGTGVTGASGTGNTGSAGTANATMDVTNSYIKLKIWKRTA